jgi:nicotinamidase-related amidase
MPEKSKRKVYEEAGIGSVELEPGTDPALVVVDLQKAFTDPDCVSGSDFEDTVEATSTLVDVAHEIDIPIYFSRVVWREDLEDGATFALKNRQSTDGVTEGSKYLKIDPSLDVAESDYIVDKKQVSVFFGTELETLLTYEHVDTVIVAGVSTSGCVRATVVDACQHGYTPIVVQDCVGDRAQKPHEINLFDMGTKYAEIWSLEECLSYLTSLPSE